MKAALSQFAIDRHFDSTRAGTTIPLDPDKFEATVNRLFVLGRGHCLIRDGYAPFCKLLFVENWMDDVHTGTLEITPENEQFLHSDFKARTDDELPVLGRWFEGINAPTAKYLCIVLYNKEQMKKEGTDIGDADYGIVAILGQMHNEEEPMPPITMMRNALGVDEGGSGVPLDREVYHRSVEFWSQNAVWRRPNEPE